MNRFKNRLEAAELLAEELAKLQLPACSKPLVLGIPRGAMPMARLIAERLGGDLDVVLVHKLPAPMHEEFAIGSVGISGHAYRYPGSENWGIKEEYWQQQIDRQVDLLKQRRRNYRLSEEGPDYTGRIVIIVDDGIATGSTMMGAIHEVRMARPDRIIVAAAVASIDAEQLLSQAADELVLLHVPQEFQAVGNFFSDFSQVEDEEVIQLLQEYRQAQA